MSQCPGKGFMGFGGVTDVKFRGMVVPGDRLIMVGKLKELRSRRAVGDAQGYVNGTLVFEGTITGMWV
jgi:3-hydroxyacyl-[acyl-carrier-protein] dehydratase